MTKLEFDYKSKHVVVQTHPRGGGARWSWSYSIDGGTTLPNRDGSLQSEEAALDAARQAAQQEIDTGKPPFDA